MTQSPVRTSQWEPWGNPFFETHDHDRDDHHQQSLSSRLCGVFTIIHLKQTIFLRHTVLQLFCIITYAICNVISHVTYVLYFTLVLSQWRMCALSNMAVFLLFCTSLISCFPGMLLRYFLNDLEFVPVVFIIIGIISAFEEPPPPPPICSSFSTSSSSSSSK